MASLGTGPVYALRGFSPQVTLQLECSTSTTSREAEAVFRQLDMEDVGQTSEGWSVCTRSWEKKQLREWKLKRRYRACMR